MSLLLECHWLLASLPLDADASLPTKTRLLLPDIGLIVLLGVVLLLLLMGWAVLIRKPRRHRQRDRTSGRKVYREPVPEESESDAARRKYKMRYRRRQHRARNPSLAETGGLPSAPIQESPPTPPPS